MTLLQDLDSALPARVNYREKNKVSLRVTSIVNTVKYEVDVRG
jgi:hypothetical protein